MLNKVEREAAQQTARGVRKNLVLLIVSLTTFMVFVDITLVNTALAAIARDFAASTSTLQWVVNGFTLMEGGLVLLGGTLGDRFGRRRALMWGAILFGAASAGAALAPDATTLILMRGLQGVGAAFMLPGTLSIITNVFDRDERPRAIAIWSMVGAVSMIVGPGLGGLIVDNISWQAVFWLHLPFVALILAGLRFVPESRDSRRLPLDVPGAALATAGLVSVIFAIIEGGGRGWTSPEILGAFALGGILLALFGLVESRSSHPMLPLRFLKQRDFIGPTLVLTTITLAMMGVFFFLTQYFQLVQGRSAFVAGLLIMPAALGMMVGAGSSAVLSRAAGPKVLATLGSAIIMGGMFFLSQVEVDSVYYLPAGGMALFGLGMGFVMPAITDTIMAAVPTDDSGIAAAMNNASRSMGATLGVAILGAIMGGAYRRSVIEGLEGSAPDDVVAVVSESLGALAQVTSGLPSALADSIAAVANQSFVDAIGDGLFVGIEFIALAIVIALLTVPFRMRTSQAGFEDIGRAAPNDPGA